MMTPLKDVKIVDAYDKDVISTCLKNQGMGWKPVREFCICEDKIRIIFERIHVDRPIYHSYQLKPLQVVKYEESAHKWRRVMPRNHYEAHGIYTEDHEELVQELLRVDSNDEYGKFYDRVKGK